MAADESGAVADVAVRTHLPLDSDTRYLTRMTTTAPAQANLGVPVAHARCFRSGRAMLAMHGEVMNMHPGMFVRWTKALRLNLPVLADRTLDVEDVRPDERHDAWVCMSRGHGDIATGVGWPLRIRDGEAIIGHAVAGENRGGDLWALMVFLRDGEDEASTSFRERCAEVAQKLGAERTVLYNGATS